MSRRLDILVPFLNERESAVDFCAMAAALAAEARSRFGLEASFILIDDGSTDGGGALFEEHMSGHWSLVTLSRNFGKESAILAGLDHAQGDYVLLMDADLQHTAEVALDMIGRILADPDLDMVYAVRADRAESRSAGRYFAQWFYWLINMGQRYEIPANAGDFRVMTRRFAEAMRQLRDQRRFNKGLYAWTGFRQQRILYRPAERQGGESKWSRRKLIAFSLEGFTSFSVVPLRAVSLFGTGVALLGFLYGVKILLEVLFTGIAVPGYPSLMVAVLVLGGLNLALTGLVGEYVWSALSEAKNRPNYIVKTITGPQAAPAAQKKKAASARAIDG
ncbi:glycosyltransferase family 2 protein [Nitratireductor sp. ZSWI3]|uniref:glycosyltransferase family 2 protein n=1 Tax=Nitratireductor sp. ZSWI3 TaxID=2966359 RepID=UPI00214F8206|nr:glycosyltransferase family 2 protein [Nitratireductor sp. ZSWI3]MCR4268972.1 glycosyltransferase family 2 protein [Nitratireductor sp. ZSWI3]